MYKEEKESLNQLKFPGIKTENIHLKKYVQKCFMQKIGILYITFKKSINF